MSSDTLGKKVEQWLRSSGYPLEMRVGAAFQRAGFRVFQSDSYADPNTEELREIDVFAYKTFETNNFVVRIHFTVECKLAPEKPWLLFTSESHGVAPPASIAQRTSNNLGRQFLRAICRVEQAQEAPLFNTRLPMCYGMTEAFAKDGNSNCYKAIMSASKAAIAAAKESSGKIRFENYLNVFFPLIVVDGQLFYTALDPLHSEPSVTPTDRGRLVLRLPSLNMPHTFVDVVSLPALENFVKQCDESCTRLFEVAYTYKADILSRIMTHEDYSED